MVWQTTAPVGTSSVAANRSILQGNTTYIETTMNVDHFWNDATATNDGYHRQVQMPLQATDPSLGTGMDGALYIKEVAGRNEGFYRNNNGVYQYIPSFKSGTVSITSTSTYVTIDSVPDQTYGQIFLFVDGSSANNGSFGFFKATDGVVHAYSSLFYFGNSTTDTTNIQFSNGDQASGLNIQGKRISSGSNTYDYRIIYWGI